MHTGCIVILLLNSLTMTVSLYFDDIRSKGLRLELHEGAIIIIPPSCSSTHRSLNTLLDINCRSV